MMLRVVFENINDYRRFAARLDAAEVIRGEVEYASSFWWQGKDWRGDMTFLDLGDLIDFVAAVALEEGGYEMEAVAA